MIGDELPLSVRKIWEERFAVFSLELEEKITVWSKQNQADDCAGYHNRVAELEKFINGFHEFFNYLMDTWTQIR